MAPGVVDPAVPARTFRSLAVLTEDYDDTLRFYLNGTKVVLDSIDPEITLLEYLRGVGLTGTKLGCAEGGCGACTVVVSQYNPTTKQIYHASVNACLAPLVSVDGKHVITIEGIGNVKAPHPAQERIAKGNGSQCGFCTPGIVMSLYALLRNDPGPSEHDVEEAFDGNLCRCTGYRPILDAAQSFSVSKTTANVVDGCCKANGDAVNGCCKDGTNGVTTNGCCMDGPNGVKEQSSTMAFAPPEFIKYDPETELIFPPSLRKHQFKALAFGNKRKRWLRPATLEQLLQIKSVYPSAKIIGGSTETQIEIKFKAMNYSVSVFVGDIPELRQYSIGEDHVEIGGNVILTDLENIVEEAIEHYGYVRAQPFAAILKQLRYFAGRQIRNVGTPAGNLATASPISDLNPVFVASRATVVAQSVGGTVEIPMSEFFKGYRTTALAPDAIIASVRIPASKKAGEYCRAYKQAKRKDDDIAIVNAALRVSLDTDNNVEDVNLAYGGMAPTTIEAKSAVGYLQGRCWTDPQTIEGVMNALEKDFNLRFGVPGGMATYRKSLAMSFFYRFYHDVCSQLGTKSLSLDPEAVDEIERAISSGEKDHQSAIAYQQRIVGKSNPHLSALKQCTGEAQYTDDIPIQRNELFGCMVLSTKAHAKILSVDASPALDLPGIVDYVDHTDLPNPEANWWGGPAIDEVFFAVDEVFTAGQPIGIILADSPQHASAGARSVKIDYEELPAIYTIEEAIEQNSFHNHYRFIKHGNTDDVFKGADHVFSGVTRMGGQEHFYLETNACVVVPKPEDGEIEIWSSTQSLGETQTFVAQVCDVPLNKVVAKVKRLGGGFGGKETRTVQLSAICALAAKKVGRPVRCMLNRDEDILTSGQRHPFLTHWKVGVKKNGKLVGLDANVFCNAGWTQDLSGAVCDRALSHIDSCYKFENVHVRGRVAKTNTVSNTAFRGFGGPQGLFVGESFMEQIADHLYMPVDKLREMNFYEPNEMTHFNQHLKDWHVPLIWNQLRKEADFEARRKEVQRFNDTHKWRKRGISLIPTKYGISFTALFRNQAGALVHIYGDGSVLVAHGGTEMGQGLHTKMTMIAAEALGIPLEDVFISETATNTVANTSPTAASASSDLNGYAILDACRQINERLAPYREKLGKDAPMSKIAQAAYFNRVNLSANGFYKTPDIGYVWGENKGQMYFYFTQGVTAAEVEIDTLTGDWTCLRADIKMDVGRSINPSIDYGQIEGAFVQGQGLFTTEESLWNRSGPMAGQIFTRGPGNYKIPGFRDIPQVFNVTMLKDVQWENLQTIHRSRGVGEPPLFMGSAVFFAIRDALKASRKMWLDQPGLSGLTLSERQSEREKLHDKDVLQLQSPATPERIRLNSGDPIVERAWVEPQEGEKSFFISI